MIAAIFFLGFTGLLAGSVIYLSRRLAWYFNYKRIRHLYIGFSAATIFMILGIGVFSGASSLLSSVLYAMAAFLMGILLYLLLCIILLHLVQVFLEIPGKKFGIIALVLTLSICVGGAWNAYSPRVTEVEVPLDGLEKEIRAIQISDIHIGHLIGGRFMQKIVDKCMEQDPDLVFITGDLFDNRSNLSRAPLAPLADFNVPVYFVEGNHDKYTGSDKVKQYLREMNVRVLENEMANQDGIQIIGLDHVIPENWAYKMHMSTGGNSIGEVLMDIKVSPDEPIILLHHSPDGIQFAREKGVDLYLAGHTHGGQIFPVNYIGELSFDYNRGLHDYYGTRIFVSQGVGTWGPPMRVGTKSEIALIKLIPDRNLSLMSGFK
jgi:predicted MPP superfamily phosphohydrolase